MNTIFPIIFSTILLCACSAARSKTAIASEEAEKFWNEVAPHATHIDSRNIQTDIHAFMQRILDDRQDAAAYIGVGDCIVRSIDTGNKGDWWHYDAFEPSNSYVVDKRAREDVSILLVAQAFIKRGVDLGGDTDKAGKVLARSRQTIHLMMNKTPDSFRHPRDFVTIEKGSFAFDNYSQIWRVERWNNKVFNAAINRAMYPNGRQRDDYGRGRRNVNRVNIRLNR